MGDNITYSKITDVAARIFGELGYDSTSLELIANAVGTDKPALNEVVGDKRTLYLDVIRQAFEAEQAMLESVAERGVQGRAAAHQIVDAYLDFYLTHPQNRTLWVQRWLSDAADITELESNYLSPMLRVAVDMIGNSGRPDVDPYYTIGTLIWSILGYMGSGLVLCRPDGTEGPEDPKAIESFRAHLHALVDGLFVP